MATVRRCRLCYQRPCMDLTRFLAQTQITSLWICQPAFAAFYVRQSLWQPSAGAEARKTIELANLRAKQPGQDAFRRLIQELCRCYPRHYLLVECVRTERFAAGLGRLGFSLSAHRPRSYWLATPAINVEEPRC